ncbi:hypothetical protein KIH39_00065 [Telmatocola sphagniphila]|uniref:Uncharacterized protein n=1 Tax=Telmatocola sphagniphila TaxID=1123043 RepID=A0A8E6B6U2_9BACT|nr:hypothetical protein [Telmatocola sphagniphila]QVL32349.1 hypothetical protein KIH39_00065 [Telmatocola sphagniphila]
MAADQKIAGYYVAFAIKGMRAAYEQVKAGVGEMLKAFKSVQESVDKMMSGMKKLGTVAAGLSASFLGLFGRGAMQGTVEADKLAAAWEYLSRVIGDSLAPYVRVLTDQLIGVAEAYRSLSPQTKDFAVKIALVGTAVGSVLAVGALIGPVIAGGFSLAAGAIGLLFTPMVGLIALFGAAGYAVYETFQLFSSSSSQASQDIQESNRSWILKLASGVADVVVFVAEKFNWVARQIVGVYDWLTKKTTWLLEKLRIVEKGTYDLVKNDPFKPWQINVDKVREGIEGIGKAVDENIPDWSDVKNKMSNFWEGLKANLEKAKNKGPGGGPGFNIKYTVAFESSQGTYDRLAQAFTGNAFKTEDIMKAQLGVQSDSQKILQDIARGIDRLAKRSNSAVVE